MDFDLIFTNDHIEYIHSLMTPVAVVNVIILSIIFIAFLNSQTILTVTSSNGHVERMYVGKNPLGNKYRVYGSIIYN